MTDPSSTLDARLQRLARFPLTTLPTPLEEYPRLAAAIGAERLLIKRDDLTGLAFGGNKVRELEYFLGAAKADGADVFVAGGGVGQSNHARQCAAAARRAGLDVHLVLRRGVFGSERVGNLLVTELLGAHIHWTEEDPGLADRDLLKSEMGRVVRDLEKAGRRPWLLTSSFHPLGAAAYALAALELRDQLINHDIARATVVCTSMGATRIGIELIVDVVGLEWDVVAVGWRPLDDGLAERLASLAARTSDLLGLDWRPEPSRFATRDHGGPAYGVPSEEGMAALRLAAVTEGLLLDPVYTSKGFAGVIGALRERAIDPRKPIVFLHTGGLPALFSYSAELPGPIARGLTSLTEPRR